MGDISELRGLIVVMSFLGAFVLLIGAMPSDFYTAGDMRAISTPEEIFETIDVYSFAETKTIWLNESGGSEWWIDPTFCIEDVDIGNWDIDFYYKDANESGLSCRLIHIHYEWIIWPADHHLKWFDKTGVDQSDSSGYLTVEDIQTNSVSNVSRWRAVCDHTTYYTSFAYNTTLYGNFTHAWNYHGLYAFFGVNFDRTNTSYNAFQLISMLLFFQMPAMNPILNAFMAIPIWICIAYLIFILLLRAIGAIFGGGA